MSAESGKSMYDVDGPEEGVSSEKKGERYLRNLWATVHDVWGGEG